MRKELLLSIALLAALSAGPTAQPVFTNIFPPEEFAARRAKVMEQIGAGVAILQGTTERPGEQPLRQSNQFYYLCGVVEPRSILVIDGKTKSSTLYLYAGAERRERMYALLNAIEPAEATASAIRSGWKFMTCNCRLKRWSRDSSSPLNQR